MQHLDSRVAANVSLGCYPAGYMTYDTKAARVRLNRDVAAFVADAIQ